MIKEQDRGVSMRVYFSHLGYNDVFSRQLILHLSSKMKIFIKFILFDILCIFVINDCSAEGSKF